MEDSVDMKYIKEGPFNVAEGAFMVWKTRWGTWQSADKDGVKLVCGPDRESVEFFSDQKLRGYPDCYTSEPGTKFGQGDL